ncbi:MAG: phosphoenolpyruvate synthase [Betaproteobacteria bacterium RIFCSPLOWO2_12_FULL_62_58]|nr:MAG: phosphoenolpyruvate synthase [Betaproteobacteria bacterium RIFCSPLOWO2_12_FULL_62_58]
MQTRGRFVRFFEEIGMADLALVGGKNASLGEMYCGLASEGVRVPNGFAVTTDAYRRLLDSAGAWPALRAALAGLDPADVDDLAQRAAKAREVVMNAPLPSEVADEILAARTQLASQYGQELSVAVRSSATAEDLPAASFAGQHDSYLNIRGEEQLLLACRRCFASLFTDRAIRYRIDHGFDHFRVFLSVGVMKMVRSDLAASGVIFTLDTESGFRDVVFVTGAHGLGENIVQGTVDPDEFYVFKPTFKAGHRVVLRRSLGTKELKMGYASKGDGVATRNVPTTPEERGRYCITDDEVLTLAGAAIKVEERYSAMARRAMPMDLEWAKDGLDGELYIIQARPETVASRRAGGVLKRYCLTGTAPVKTAGRAVGENIASGRARVIHSPAELAAFRSGEILVAETTAPDWGTVMKTAAAIVTNHGGRTCHAAIVARELGIPAIVGAEGATQRIATGEEITVSCAEGTVGRVYAGAVPFEISQVDVEALARPRTHVMVNLGNPDIAFSTSFLPNDGVGLARMEFIITEYIKAHPMALAHPERIADPAERSAVEQLALGYATPADYFVERLSEGVATIAAAFYPKPVIVRMSDFKTNEYASLLGGRSFEPAEKNPMIGFRGASRYAHPAYADGFALECRAMRRVREAMGLDNVKLMIPFCRRIAEAELVLATMAGHGLARGEAGLEIYVMCEIPNNVILIDRFARLFDGFSIGSNDLTQLALGVDRDSEIVAFDFDERDEGVKELIRLAVTGAHRNGRHCGICGQAPSDFPEIAEYLVRIGIDSISVNPDTLLQTRKLVLEVEQQIEAAQRAGRSMQ